MLGEFLVCVVLILSELVFFFQKEPFNRRNMKEAGVRKGMFSS